MSSSTESSDWNLSPGSRPQINLPDNDATFRPPIDPMILQDPPTTARRGSSSSTPRLGSFSVPNIAAGQAQLSPPNILISMNRIEDIVRETMPVEPTSTNQTVPSNAEWQAARAAILGEKMSPTQDINPPPKTTRGGAKTRSRGGRGGGVQRPKIKIEPASGESVPTLANFPPNERKVNRGGRPRGSRAGTTSNRSVNRGGRPRGSRAGVSAATSRRTVKRKRKIKESDDEEADDTSSSEVIAPPQLSSSGRRITQANTTLPGIINLDAPSASTAKKARTAARVSDAAPVFLTGAMKRKRARNPAEAAVCRNCGRGHSPNSNQIVFCDGCNTPWHQYCHDRPITPTVILNEEAEWQCADCGIEASLAQIGKGRVNSETLTSVTGMDRTLKWKQDYLMSVPKEVLVSLLLRAQETHEELPLFEPNAKVGLGVSTAVPVLEEKAQMVVVEAKAKGKENEKEKEKGEEVEGMDGASPIRKGGDGEAEKILVVDEDEGYYEEPLPYPKMGNGLVLPPEEEDVDILVDENEMIYSHSWQEGPDGLWKGAFSLQDSAIKGDCQWCHRAGYIGFRSRVCAGCNGLRADTGSQADEVQQPLPLVNGWHGDE